LVAAEKNRRSTIHNHNNNTNCFSSHYCKWSK